MSNSKMKKNLKKPKRSKNKLSKKLAKFNFEKDWRPTIFVCVILPPLIISLVWIPIAMYFILKNYVTSYEINKLMLTHNSGIIFKKMIYLEVGT